MQAAEQLQDPTVGREIGRDAGSTADWAFDQLWGRIVQGELRPGDRITEESLSERLAVSRTPLREAIRRLEMVGLIVRQRSRGLRVAELSLDEMLRLSLLREALEGVMARHAARRYAAGEIQLHRLEALADEMAAVDPRRGLALLLRLGNRFHRELRELSGDPLGARVLEQVLLSFERYRYLIDRDYARGRDLAIEHGAIVCAIKSGDEEKAEAEIRRHVRNARAIYARRLAALPDIARV